MSETISFVKQLSENLDLSHAVSLPKGQHYILGGMGGSHLAAGLLKVLYPGINIYVHRSYGLPPFSKEFFKQGVCIASSYSGNTEETLSFYSEAKNNGYPLVVVTSGGKLFELAKSDGHPVVLIPKGLQPRDALGYFVKALVHTLQDKDIQVDMDAFIQSSKEVSFDEEASELTQKLKGRIPLVYSSLKNLSLSYIWKIKYNETSKIPAFYNIFPELNHNEMEGFDSNANTAPLGEKFSVVLLMDATDDKRIIKRMQTLRDLYREKNIPVIEVNLNAKSPWHKVAHSVELSHTHSRLLGASYGSSPDEVPLIEDFKKKIA